MIFFLFFLIYFPVLTFSNDLFDSFDINKDYALITSQESNLLDIIDLDLFKKVGSLKLGKSPAGIDVSNEKKIVFVANPNSDEISIIDFKNNTNVNIHSGNSPLGIAYDDNKKNVFVSNWYDNLISVIDINTNLITSKISVGKSPAGIALHPLNNDIVVANKESNSITIIDNSNYSNKKELSVQKSPFGVFFDQKGEFIYVTNVQSNSISIINYHDRKLLKNIKVGEWPYQVAIDNSNKKLYVTNQRGNSISVINIEDHKVENTLTEICEYPEGININLKKKIIVVACWFDNEIIILDLKSNKLIKKVKVSDGPRAFGNFLITN